MKKFYDISIKKTVYGFCKIQANDEEEARSKASKEISEESSQIEYFEDEQAEEIIGIDCLEN